MPIKKILCFTILKLFVSLVTLRIHTVRLVDLGQTAEKNSSYQTVWFYVLQYL